MGRLAPAFVLFALALAACGDSGEKGPGGGGSLTVEAVRDGRVEASEYDFDPSRIVVTGAAGEASPELSLTLDNRGSLAHNLKVFEGDRQLGGTPTFEAGRRRSGSVRVAPGKYELVCTVGNHAELGMVGTLEVRR